MPSFSKRLPRGSSGRHGVLDTVEQDGRHVRTHLPHAHAFRQRDAVVFQIVRHELGHAAQCSAVHVRHHRLLRQLAWHINVNPRGGQMLLERLLGFGTALSIVIDFVGGVTFLLILFRSGRR